MERTLSSSRILVQESGLPSMGRLEPFAIMQEASLDGVAAELYLSYRSSGPAWVKLLTPHWVKHPTRSPTVYSPDPSVLQVNKLTHTLGNISPDLASFLVITMAQRAPYWRRAITVIGA